MDISPRPLTRVNLWPVVDLKLHPEQVGHVEVNVASIANTYVEPTFVPLAVYAGEEPVGFCMYGQHPTSGARWVIRLMIERTGCEEIITSFVPANAVAASLAAALGFRPTREWDDGVPLAALSVAEWRATRDR